MQSITIDRRFGADPEAVRSAIRDVGPFMRAARFDEVRVDGDHLEIANAVGLGKIELDLRIRDDPDAVLSYEQVDGIFEHMETVYTVEEHDDGTLTVACTTEFAIDALLVGDILDATVIKRQRRKELTAQLDYLEDECGS